MTQTKPLFPKKLGFSILNASAWTAGHLQFEGGFTVLDVYCTKGMQKKGPRGALVKPESKQALMFKTHSRSPAQPHVATLWLCSSLPRKFIYLDRVSTRIQRKKTKRETQSHLGAQEVEINTKQKSPNQAASYKHQILKFQS